MSLDHHLLRQTKQQLVAAVALLVLTSGNLICNSLPVELERTQAENNQQQQQQQTLLAESIHQTKQNLTKRQLSNPFAPRPISYVFDSKQLSPYMQMRKLSPTSNNITCNDGSHVGYYLRQNVHSKSWVIFLQGGGFCASPESCQQRWQQTPHLMSSNYWPKTKSVEGILSSEPKQNPYLWNANHVYVPYCSSDSWTGLSQASSSSSSMTTTEKSRHSSSNNNYDDTTDSFSNVDFGSSQRSFSFMGSKIIERVLTSLYDDLARESSLHEAKFVLLAGESAGATGVILNLDKLKQFIERRFEADKLAAQVNCTEDCANSNNSPTDNGKQAPIVRGLADSGWFLDNEPYIQAGAMLSDLYLDSGSQQTDFNGPNESECDRSKCSPLQLVKQAMRYWNGQVPEACADAYQAEPWRCYFGYRAHQTLQTPLFVVQWLYDEFQLLADNIVRPITGDQWDYVNNFVNELRQSFENVTALFAPSCFAHNLIAKPTWNQININGLRLPHVLNSWEEQSLIDTTNLGQHLNQQSSSEGVANSRDQLTQMPQIPTITDEFSVIGQDGAYANNNRPTIETLLIESLDSTSGQPPTSFVFPIQQDQPQPPAYKSSTQLMPSRSYRSAQINGSDSQHQVNAGNRQATAKAGRKRRRNNNANNNRNNRQVRQRIQPKSSEQQSGPQLTANIRESNELPPSDVSMNQGEINRLPVISAGKSSSTISFSDRTHARLSSRGANSPGRLGRSTQVNEEPTSSMQSNNVPDDNISKAVQAANFPHQIVDIHTPLISSQESSKFRLIDSCGWPQCNRDCPNLNSDFNLGVGI